jgi:hypothetical protein
MPLGNAPVGRLPRFVLPIDAFVPESSALLNIVFLAEAFSSEADFRDATVAILGLLEGRTLFSRASVSRVMFYRFYHETNAHNDNGPSDGSSGQHTTLLGTTVDAAGLLNLDLDALNRVTPLVVLGKPGDELRATLVEPGLGLARTILVVLLPDPPGATASRGRAVRYGDTVVPDDTTPLPPTVTTAEHDFIIAEAGGKAHLLLLRQIGELFELAPEWSVPESAPDGAQYNRPTTLHGSTDHGPNLVYIPADGSPPSYRRSLDMLVASGGPGLLGLDRVQAGAPIDTGIVHGRYIETLHEGGGGYRRDFYRTAPDCIMRRRLPHEYTGAGPDPVALGSAPADLVFCPACEAHLEPMLRDSASRRPISFDRQRNKFEQIRWGNARRGESFASVLDSPTSHSVDARPANCAAGKHYFVFDMELSNADGLIFTNIFNDRDAAGSIPSVHRPIAEELRFRDLRVRTVSPDGTSRIRGIDLASAAASGRVETFYGTDGKLEQDGLWHHGFLYRAVVNIDDEVEVTVEQSVCFRGPANDFDPTMTVVAIKVYPELCFSYRSLDGVTVVDRFHGCVWQNVDPKSEPMMHPEGGEHHHPSSIPENPDGIFTSWFAEINGLRNRSWIMGRTRQFMSPRQLLFAPPVAFYSGIFAYWQTQEDAVPRPDPDIVPPADAERAQTEMEVIAVRHVAQARRDRPTEAVYKWRGRDTILTSGTTDHYVLVTRETREGQYDNVHNHGWMGVSRNPGSATSPEMVRRMAPVCGQACIHLHVRWLVGGDVLNAINNVSVFSPFAYWGWGDDPLTAAPHSVQASPLVPPNQRVRIAVTNPATDRVNAGNPASMSTVLPGTNLVHGVRIARLLDNTNRGLWYDVDVEGHIVENQKHVILEQGWGYAADHATPEYGYEVLAIRWLRNTGYYLGYDDYTGRESAYLTDPFEQVMMYVYDCWLFHLHDGVQIPYGDWQNSRASNPSMPIGWSPPYQDLSMEQF